MIPHATNARPFFAILQFLVCLALVLAATGCGQEESGKSASAAQATEGTPKDAPKDAPKGTPKEAPKDAVFAILREARDRAKKEDKLLLVELYDDTCGYCETLESETLSDSSVVKALEDFVHVRITLEQKSLIKAFKLRISPAFLCFKPGMSHLKPTLQGFRSPEVFLAELQNYRLRGRGEEPKSVPEDSHSDYGLG